jgi:hypothetical protein
VLAAADARAVANTGNNAAIQAGATYLVTGLANATNYTVTAKYRVTAGTGTFANRDVVVVVLP